MERTSRSEEERYAWMTENIRIAAWEGGGGGELSGI